MLKIALFHSPNYKSFLFMGKGAHPSFPYPSPMPGESSMIVPKLIFLANDQLYYFLLRKVRINTIVAIFKVVLATARS